ncbi:MAG: SDR family oxidoreductase [Gammaproteobacteria bacterium]|nr:SDR family oxidoreductase [Gammaproteobacteria bacterium]MBU1444141.1 SDR family oxidoreductase [Gammaproteobacteria bacterium]MBU2287594.1 SDR family oxidoreductase [Gammaproteobacteria bacterium]
MDLGISGKWALVCGASKGLGWGCASALVREGVHVVVVARGASALQQAVERLRAIGGASGSAQAVPVAADITTSQGRAAVLAVRRDFDIVVTNAGGPLPGDFRDWDRDTWIEALDANMLAPIELIKATVDGMVARGFGRVINITSSAVKAPIEILGLSNGARSGLTGFIAGLARTKTLAQANVTLNNLLPGAFATERLRTAMEKAGNAFGGKSYDEVVADRVQGIPARRLGTPDEFGALCAFLCSDQAGYITGQNFLIDGGAYPGTL